MARHHTTPSLPRRKRRRLSPNRVDQELARERQAPARRRAKSSRGQTLWRRRFADLLRRWQRQRRRRTRLPDDAGRIVRDRVRCLRRYERLRRQGCEGEAAQRAGAAYGVSPHTVRRWQRLYQRGGRRALLPQPRGPRAAARRVAPATEALVVALRTLYGWNEKRLAHELRQRGLATLSHTTVGRIFWRRQLPTRPYHPVAPRAGIAYRRYERGWPNAQWHIDFTEVALEEGQRLLVAVLIDDQSRFCLACELVAALSAETAWTLLQASCRRYGVQPQELVSDNGRAFVSVYAGVPTCLGRGLAAWGIRHRTTAPYYPEGNGKAEAFIKTLKREALAAPLTSVAEVQQRLAAFQRYYNFDRLHSSLGYLPPAVRYWGVAAPQQHGLAGLPGLPADLRAAYPPAPDYVIVASDPALRRRMLALVPLAC